jgi:FixJ family two-component response regulator
VRAFAHSDRSSTVSSLDHIRKRYSSLSPRQRETALRLADGLSNTAIAALLGVSVHTVKAHRAEVMLRMEASSFAHLVAQLQRVRRIIPAMREQNPLPLRVLVVEDDGWYRDYLTLGLRDRQFAAVGVGDAPGFEVEWARQAAAIVVLDIELGATQEDGLSIAARLMATRSCGVIVVSARGAVEDRIKGLGAGADAYFSKPVNIDELAASITNLARRLG